MKGFQGPKDPSELHRGGLNPLGQRVGSWNPPNLETSGPSEEKNKCLIFFKFLFLTSPPPPPHSKKTLLDNQNIS